jgi:NADH:ubiquinone oxidoreductase subunit 5 (subunit L)/multisubunit Na+/H+ antiporter MnhA subunit
MHAGLINAGGFLLIRLSPLFVATPITMAVAVVVGGVTAIYGTTIMLTRNDVKGMLVYSTVGQMGFMILECGLGAFGLAALHLVAHGLFKATLFLGSGSVIQQKTENQHLAPATHNSNRLPVVRFAISNIIVLAILFLLTFWLGFPINTGTILLAFAWFTIMYAVTQIASLPSTQFYAGLVGFTLLYVLGTHAVEAFFKPVIAPTPGLEPALVFAICGVLVMVGLASIAIQNLSKPAWLNRLYKSLYMRILFTGYGK